MILEASSNELYVGHENRFETAFLPPWPKITRSSIRADNRRLNNLASCAMHFATNILCGV